MKKTVAILVFSGVFTGLLLFAFLPMTADAAGIVPCGRIEGTTEEQQPCTLCHLIVGIDRVINYGFKIMVFVALVSIVAGGIFYMVSAGNEQMMEKAKGVIKNTLYGFGIVLLAWVIVNYTMVLLSTKDSNNDGKPDFGIGIVKWNKFECSTESRAGRGSRSLPPIENGLPTCDSLGGSCRNENFCGGDEETASDCGEGEVCCVYDDVD